MKGANLEPKGTKEPKKPQTVALIGKLFKPEKELVH